MSLSIVHSLLSTGKTQFIRYTHKMSRKETFLHRFALLNKYNRMPSDLNTSLAALLTHRKHTSNQKTLDLSQSPLVLVQINPTVSCLLYSRLTDSLEINTVGPLAPRLMELIS